MPNAVFRAILIGPDIIDVFHGKYDQPKFYFQIYANFCLNNDLSVYSKLPAFLTDMYHLVISTLRQIRNRI